MPILCFSFNLLFATQDGCNVPAGVTLAEPAPAGLSTCEKLLSFDWRNDPLVTEEPCLSFDPVIWLV